MIYTDVFFGHLVLADLAEDEVPQLLRLVAEHQHAAVLADDAQHLLSHVDHELGLDDGVVPGRDHRHLHRGAGRRGERGPVRGQQGVLELPENIVRMTIDRYILQ